MGRIKRLVLMLVMLLFMLVVLIFVLENQQSVTLLFLGWTGPQLSVSVVAVSALLVGMTVGPLMSWLCSGIVRAKRKRLI
ncbi:LapA family protein [Pseudomonas sp. GB2N2]